MNLMKPIRAYRILLFLFILLNFWTLSAQMSLEGVTKIGIANYGASFLFKDSKNNIWEGNAVFLANDKRENKGLHKYENKIWKTLFQSGIFTDILESDSTVIISAYDGLHFFSGINYQLDTSLKQNSCLSFFNSNLLIGTMGNGLYEMSLKSYRKIPIVIAGVSYDSVYSLKAEGKILWIGTSNGLIKYNGSVFTRFEIPVKPTSKPFGNANQKAVISIQKDKNDRVWVLTKNQQDSIECIYILKDSTFISARAFYETTCFSKYLIPYSGLKLDLNSSGNVIIGMSWGILEFSESIKNIVLNDLMYSPSFYNKNGQSLVYSDKQGNYLASIFPRRAGTNGIFIIDKNYFPTLESSKSIRYNTVNFNTIDINEIKVSTANDGTMFNSMDQMLPFKDLPTFNIPSIGCSKPIYSAALWIGGLDQVNNNLHVAAQTYRQNGSDYLPGPIDLLTGKYDSSANGFYNKIWKIDRKTIEIFKLNYNKPFYTIPAEILDWPAHGIGNFTQNLAPFEDVDNNRIYEPKKGDYPKIKGDQMLWWVFNDLGIHTETGGQNLGMEIQGSCYAFYHKELSFPDTNAIVNRTVFFNYKLTNRSIRNYKRLYVGVFNDIDLGNYADDLVGCDSVQNTGFGYNSDSYDDLPSGFGKNPPVIFCKFLNQDMTNFMSYDNGFGSLGSPSGPEHYYSYLRSSIKSDTSFAGKRFLQHGFPCSNAFNDSIKLGGDKRFLMSTNTPTLNKDSSFELEFAYILLHNPDINYLEEACDEPKHVLQRIQSWYNHGSFPSKPYNNLSSTAFQANYHNLTLYPNPAGGILNIQADLESNLIETVVIVDKFGRNVLQWKPSRNSGNLNLRADISSLSSGIYTVSMNSKGGTIRKILVKE